MALHLKSTGLDFADFSDASEDSELLDDYEEGTWTGDNNNYAATSTVTDEIYVKVGRMVWVAGESHYAGTSGNYNGINLEGSPYTSVASQQTYFRGAAHPETPITSHPGVQISQNSTTITFNNDGAGAQRYNQTLRDLGDNGIYFSIWYPTAV